MLERRRAGNERRARSRRAPPICRSSSTRRRHGSVHTVDVRRAPPSTPSSARHPRLVGVELIDGLVAGDGDGRRASASSARTARASARCSICLAGELTPRRDGLVVGEPVQAAQPALPLRSASAPADRREHRIGGGVERDDHRGRSHGVLMAVVRIDAQPRPSAPAARDPGSVRPDEALLSGHSTTR